MVYHKDLLSKSWSATVYGILAQLLTKKALDAWCLAPLGMLEDKKTAEGNVLLQPP